jgi:hypothetical protein
MGKLCKLLKENQNYTSAFVYNMMFVISVSFVLLFCRGTQDFFYRNLNLFTKL